MLPRSLRTFLVAAAAITAEGRCAARSVPGFSGEAQAYASSSDGTYKLSSWPAPVRGDGSPGSNSTWKLSIDDSDAGHRQEITGFGFVPCYDP